MKVNIKKLDPSAVIPTYSKVGDAGLDLTATSMDSSDNTYLEYGTGLAVEIPEGYVGLVFPRSSVSNYDLTLANSVGVIDSNYRGEIKLRFRFDRHTWPAPLTYKVGDRIGQLVIMPIPQIELNEVETLDDSNRGEEGFGSSGN